MSPTGRKFEESRCPDSPVWISVSGCASFYFWTVHSHEWPFTHLNGTAASEPEAGPFHCHEPDVLPKPAVSQAWPDPSRNPKKSPVIETKTQRSLPEGRCHMLRDSLWKCRNGAARTWISR